MHWANTQARYLVQPPSGEVIAIAIVVQHLLVGFFQGFLLAYLWLPGAFVRATQGLGQQGSLIAREPTSKDTWSRCLACVVLEFGPSLRGDAPDDDLMRTRLVFRNPA